MARRQSVLQEGGPLVAGDERAGDSTRRERPQNVRFRSQDEVHVVERYNEDTGGNKELKSRAGGAVLPQGQSASDQKTRSTMYRFGAALLFIGALISLLQSFGVVGKHAVVPIQPVSGGTIPAEVKSKRENRIERRETSRTSWCFKWAHQSTIVNGTLFMYGGQVATEYGQIETLENTWTNDFLTLDLSTSWGTGAPPLTGLQRPSDVPAVALGFLWNSPASLFLYGGETSWVPDVLPEPFSTWEYNIPNGEWIQHSDPVTSSGLSAPESGVPVQGAAEGAGVNVPTMGRGYYFGGHLDHYTTPGWDVQVPRLYLQSLLEFTFPGYPNADVTSLGNNGVAGSDGVYRNITQGGIQESYGFTARADGILAFIPGFGDQGILVALGGGTNETFTPMNIIDVYDIATSSWYQQAANGEYPDTRVNPCSVVAAAPDGSSYNIYMFGGQELEPYGDQPQKDDMWILSIPSFIWFKVDMSGQSVPPGRSGATCNIWDGQMVMVGGYPGTDISCEYPGVFVFDLGSCVWQTKFTAYSDNEEGIGRTNFMNQQPLQVSTDSSPGGLEGSYGYTVPDIVVSKIGGNQYGGATITKPTLSATAGPFKTGSPIMFSTETGVPSGFTEGSSNKGTRVAAIVVGVVCGLALILICYLLFCLFVYRKQLALYKRHVEMSQAQARGEKAPEIPGLWASDSAQYDSDQSKPTNNFRDTGSHIGSSNPSNRGSAGVPASNGPQSGTQSARRSSEVSDTEDLLADHEPTFVGVMLNPRRSLRVINRD